MKKYTFHSDKTDKNTYFQFLENIDYENYLFEKTKSFSNAFSLSENGASENFSFDVNQKAINELGDDIDTIIIVGSKKSSNTMKLYEVAKKKHLNKAIYLLENIEQCKALDIKYKNAVIASGTSTPLNTINEIKSYLEERNK